MNCQSFEDIVNELSRDRVSGQTMDASLRERALVHANECAGCAMRLQDERALSRCLDGMAFEMKALTAPTRVEVELRQAFRQRSAARGQRSEISGGRNRWLLAAAAVLLIVFGIGGLLRYVITRPSPVTSESEQAVAQTSPKPAPANVAVDPGNAPAKPDREMAVAPENIVRHAKPYRRALRVNPPNSGRQVLAAAPTAIGSDADSEVATEFMPLGYAGPINLQDGGQLVRVELPRSAMLSLGLPVNMDRYSQRVKADVFVGVDGLARAIRFVQ